MTLDLIQEHIIEALPSVEAKDLEAVALFVQSKIDEALMDAANAAAIRLNNIYNDRALVVIENAGVPSYYVEHYAAAQAVRDVIEAKTSIASESAVNA